MFKLLCRWFFPPQSCASQSSYQLFQSSPAFCEEDLWIEIAKHLDGKSLVMLAATCHWFKHIMMEECVWKFACVRDLVQVPDPKKVAFKWIKLYAAAFDGSHSFMFRHKEKHIGTMQIVEARHMDLLTNEEYQNGSGEYEQISFHEIKKHAISGRFYGFQHMSDAIISEFFGPESWAEELLMPKDMDLHAVALKTELKENEGLFIRCYVMRAGADGELVSIRISQC